MWWLILIKGQTSSWLLNNPHQVCYSQSMNLDTNITDQSSNFYQIVWLCPDITQHVIITSRQIQNMRTDKILIQSDQWINKWMNVWSNERINKHEWLIIIKWITVYLLLNVQHIVNTVKLNLQAEFQATITNLKPTNSLNSQWYTWFLSQIKELVKRTYNRFTLHLSCRVYYTKLYIIEKTWKNLVIVYYWKDMEKNCNSKYLHVIIHTRYYKQPTGREYNTMPQTNGNSSLI